MSDFRIVLVGAEQAFAFAVRDIIAAQLPGAVFDITEPSRVRARPAAVALVIDSRAGSSHGVELAARLRAMGFAGAVALISAPLDQADTGASGEGFVVVSPDRLPSELMPALAEQLRLADSPYAPLVMRARRLVAAGEIAQRLQHSLNNPLMGLLAEAQLMQLDKPSEEHAAALERMVALCRRMVELTRTLDGLSERKSTS
jgi:signal transduction histidine kinase